MPTLQSFRLPKTVYLHCSNKERPYARLSFPPVLRFFPPPARDIANRSGGMRFGVFGFGVGVSRFPHGFAPFAGAFFFVAQRGDAGGFGALCPCAEPYAAPAAFGIGRAGKSAPALYPALGFEPFCSVAVGVSWRYYDYEPCFGLAENPHGRSIAAVYGDCAGVAAEHAV